MPPFLSSEFDMTPPESAAFHIISAPLESSVSYGGGTAGGPAAILEASQQLEMIDSLGRQPGTRGLYTAPAVEATLSADLFLTALQKQVSYALKCNAIPITLGGEHTITLAPVRALLEHNKSFGIIQFDAHADLRAAYQDNPLSHASVMRRIVELGVPLYQIGIRSLCDEEIAARARFGVNHLDARQLFLNGDEPCLPSHFPEQVYISFDIDAFDASLMPATGTPEPGGLLWWDALRVLCTLMDGRRLLGADVVELAPQPGQHACAYTAAKLAYTLMGFA